MEGEGLALGAEFDDEAVARRGGAVLDRQAERVAAAAQIEVGVAPGVEFGGAAQGLPGAGVRGALAGVVDEQHGGVEVALEVAQVGEHRRDLGRGVLVDAVQADEGIEHEQRGPQGRDRLAQAVLGPRADPGARSGR